MLLFGLYLASSIARPVREAAEGASRFASGELSVRLEQGGPGEVGELTEGFNQMAERLESARAELEEQNAQLRESERLKSDLVNTVSHELRTPLSGVLGFTKLLLSRDFDSETRRHYLGIVDAQARRLSELIDDFLDVRRIEEGRFERAQELLDMAALLREEAQLYSAQSPKHRLALTLPEEPLPVIGSPDRLRQVIGNLLSNAIKYSPQGGIVELSGRGHQRHCSRGGAATRGSASRLPSRLRSSRSSSAETPRQAGFRVRGSGSPCHEISSSRTAAASGSRAPRAKGRRSSSSFRAETGRRWATRR